MVGPDESKAHCRPQPRPGILLRLIERKRRVHANEKRRQRPMPGGVFVDACLSMEEQVDQDQDDAGNAQQPCQKIFTHDVLRFV
jgi:hypothetical protein